MTIDGAMPALLALDDSVGKTGLPKALRELVHLRVSQINGCSVCVSLHSGSLKKMGESDDKLFAVAAWRDTPYFTEPERAALALAEAGARIDDRSDPVSDEVWQAAAKHFSEAEMGGLAMTIGLINLWNRINLITGQVAGAAWS